MGTSWLDRWFSLGLPVPIEATSKNAVAKEETQFKGRIL